MAKLGIGMPVYNGERYLSASLESILGQTFRDFRLVVSDNCSTDGTGEIGKHYAALDDRVTYHRRDRNFGAANNYDHAFHLCKGRYFKWAAHDDILLPTYLESCVAILDKDRSAVGAHSLTELIDDQSNPFTYDKATNTFRDSAGQVHKFRLDDLTHNEDDSPVARFKGILEGSTLDTAVFGIYRRDIMERTGLHLPFWGSDKVLLAEFALHGRLRVVNEPLFRRRVHAEQASNLSAHDQVRWLAPEKSYFPLKTQLAAMRAYLGAIHRAPLSKREKWRCLMLVLGQASDLRRWSLSYLGLSAQQKDPRRGAEA